MYANDTEFLSREEGLEINIVDDGYVVYQPNRDKLHYLNHIAGLILELSNGKNTELEIAGLLRDVYKLPQDPTEEAAQGLELLRKLRTSAWQKNVNISLSFGLPSLLRQRMALRLHVGQFRAPIEFVGLAIHRSRD